MKPPILFTPLTIGNLLLRNRVVMSPMCQYFADDGMASDWHLAHYGSRAALGVGLVLVEATAVEARGRISPNDLGLWKDEQVEPLRRVASFVRAQGAAIGVQLAHAGRKAGTARPWDGGRELPRDRGGWERVAPSPLAYTEGGDLPRELSLAELGDIVGAFVAAARRAERAGFEVLEIHAAHGYLLHEFLSPLTNRRVDAYGGSLENRARLLLDVVDALRALWPAPRPLLVRLSATDWAPGGWDLPDCVDLAKMLITHKVDLVDVSTGGLVPSQTIKPSPGFQVPFAESIRKTAKMPTGAVGLITEASQAEAILEEGRADLVILGRELLRNPGWAIGAAHELGAASLDGRSVEPGAGMVPQYQRARREPK